MMRSPGGRSPVTEFCASCNEIPDGPQAKPSASVSDSSSTFTSHISRSSTPPTDISSALSSPVFAPPIETEESLRRREQSDRASAEIGKRLLKGWAMLGDECINTRCYGIPLVRPPKVGGEKSPRKECVICGTVYVSELDWAGREHLVIADSVVAANNTLNPSNTQQRGELRAQEGIVHTSKEIFPLQHISNAAIPPSTPGGDISIQSGSALQVLAESSNALQSTLRTLSARLTALSATQAPDTTSIGSTADAINKVTQALIHVRQLQWSEEQVQRLV